jgi:hypothetical protein
MPGLYPRRVVFPGGLLLLPTDRAMAWNWSYTHDDLSSIQPR